MLRKTLVIALIALIVSACCSSRTTAVQSDVRSKMSEVRCDTLMEQVVVAVHDTIMETTTINVQTSEAGDTLRLVQITDRTRASNRAAVKDKEERVRVERDTVYVERRDSVLVSEFQGSRSSSRASPVVSALKWVFAVIIALCVLLIILRFKGLRV